MLKITGIFTILVLASAVPAHDEPRVMTEIEGSWEYATITTYASHEAGSCGNIGAALATLAVFQADPTANSVAVSMLNNELNNLATTYTNNTAIINAVPIVADCVGVLVAHAFKLNDAATLLGKKAAYGLGDLALAITGHNATASASMAALGYTANFMGLPTFATLLYENAGLLIGDATFALGTAFESSNTAIASTFLLSMFNARLAIERQGKGAVAIASGVALSSSFVLLNALLG